MVNESAYLSTKEASDLLGISLKTAQLWVENGILSAWKTPGGHRRILKHSVDCALKERLEHHPSHKKTVLRVLIIEDDPDILNLLALTVRHFKPDIDVLIAKNGFEGLIAVGQSNPDLIFTDINMPEVDGLQMIRAIGTGEAAPRKIVAITALNPNDLSSRGPIPPNLEILYKPIHLKDIERILDQEYELNLLG